MSKKKIMSAKYIRIAKRIIEQIEREHILIGAKMPSLRQFCELHNF